jgi:hypothetical protein
LVYPNCEHQRIKEPQAVADVDALWVVLHPDENR